MVELAAFCAKELTRYGFDTILADDQFGDAVFGDPYQTNLEAYRAGLRALRAAAGPDTYIAACNVAQNFRSMGGSIGLADAMRIGPDTGADWGAILPNFHLGTRLYFLHNRVWHNDPDCLMVRAPLTLTQARSFASWIAVSGSPNLVSEWLPGLPADRLDCIKRSMPNSTAPPFRSNYRPQAAPLSRWLRCVTVPKSSAPPVTSPSASSMWALINGPSRFSRGHARWWEATRRPFRQGVHNTGGMAPSAKSMACFASTTNFCSPTAPTFGRPFMIGCGEDGANPRGSRGRSAACHPRPVPHRCSARPRFGWREQP